MIRTPITHYVEPERRVGELSADIHHSRRFLQDIEVLVERFPTEIDAFCKDDLGNVLDPFHQVDKKGLRTGANRREADPAIAEDRRCHAVPRRRGHGRAPGRLAVVVRVDVHPSGQDQQAFGGYVTPCGAGLGFQRGNHPSVIATSAWRRGAPVPSITVPLRMTKSCIGVSSAALRTNGLADHLASIIRLLGRRFHHSGRGR